MSDTSPRDQPGLLFNAKARAAREAVAGELLFAFRRGHDRFQCELRDHGRYGVEAQFLKNEELLVAHTCPSRELAIAWSEETRAFLMRQPAGPDGSW